MEAIFYESRPYATLALGLYSISKWNVSGLMGYSGLLLVLSSVIILWARYSFRRRS